MNGRSSLPSRTQKVSLPPSQLAATGPGFRRRLRILTFVVLLVAFAALSFRRVVQSEDSATQIAGARSPGVASHPPSASLSPAAAPGEENVYRNRFGEAEEDKPVLEGDLDESLPDHDETVTFKTISSPKSAPDPQGTGKRDDLPAQQPGIHQMVPERTALIALSFDVESAGREWDKAVGCEAFREKHRGIIYNYSRGGWVPSNSFQSPFDPRTDSCDAFKLKHVTVFLAHPNWLPGWMDGSFSCSCGITCVFSRSKILAPDPDAELYQGAQPPWPRKHGETLKASLNLESSDRKPPANIWINYSPGATVQCMFAGNVFHIDRSRTVADRKRDDAPLFFAASNPSKHRESLAKPILSLIKHHSVGKQLNNMEGVSEFDMYPYCRHDIPRDFGSSLHCVISHYKFSLAVENRVDPGYVTERFFYPLESGTVPVYLGAPDVAEFAPPDSFIDARGVAPNELKRRIDEIANDTIKYMNFLAWRRCGVLGNYARARAMSLDTVPCRLCEEVSKQGGRGS